MIKFKSILHNRPIYEIGLDLNKISNIELPNVMFTCIDSNCFSGFINLKEINLSNNQLTSLTDANLLNGLNKLIHIDLSSNHITRIYQIK